MTDAEVVLPRPVSYLTPMTLDLDFYVPFSPWLWCQKHTVKARAVAFTMVLVPKTLGEGKRPLPSPWFWCQGYAVKARGRCLHHGFGAKDTR